MSNGLELPIMGNVMRKSCARYLRIQDSLRALRPQFSFNKMASERSLKASETLPGLTASNNQSNIDLQKVQNTLLQVYKLRHSNWFSACQDM